MLSDIKNQLNQMQSQSMASASKDAEAIAEVVRNEIRRAMMVRGTTGLTIQDTIDEKMSGIAHDDRVQREDGSDRRRLAWVLGRLVCLVPCLGFPGCRSPALVRRDLRHFVRLCLLSSDRFEAQLLRRIVKSRSLED